MCQKTGKGHQVSCRLKPPHSIKFSPCCHGRAHAKLRDCPFSSPVTLRGSFSTPDSENPDRSEHGPSPWTTPDESVERGGVISHSYCRAWLWHDWHQNHWGKPGMLRWERAKSRGWWLQGGISPSMSVWLPVKLPVRARRMLCGKASEGPAGGRFQCWGRCAYTVELAKPADPAGTESGATRGGEAALRGATGVLAMDKSAASQAPISPGTPGLTLARFHSLPICLL